MLPGMFTLDKTTHSFSPNIFSVALFLGQQRSTEELQNKAEARINNRALKPHALILCAALLTSSQILLYLMVFQLGIGVVFCSVGESCQALLGCTSRWPDGLGNRQRQILL